MQIRRKIIIIFAISMLAISTLANFSFASAEAGIKVESGKNYCVGSDGKVGREATDAEVNAGVCTGNIGVATGSSNSSSNNNVSQAAGSTKAVILKNCGNKKGTEGVMCIVGIALNIFTVIIGILGVLGIVISGIQYMTAGGNETKTTKAKRRMIEIVIGLAIYVALSAILTWVGVIQ